MQEVTRRVPLDEPPPLPENAKLQSIGKPISRLDGVEKVTGKARYTFDVQLPGMLWGKRVVSPLPHARIKSIDTSAAERYPGVRAVHVLERVLATAKLRDPNAEKGHRYPTVRYAGQPIAAVAADTPSAAEAAAKLIKVEYEPLPHVTDMEEAMKEGAPRVFPGPTEQPATAGGGGAPPGLPQKGNVRGPDTRPRGVGPRGDVTKGFSESDVVFEAEFRTQVQTHVPMEPHGVVAKAGGMDLLDLMKGGVVSPRRVVNLKTIPGLDGVRFDARQGLELGALVTLARLSNEPEVRRRFVALAEAAEHAATPQVRNAATLGGNLLQRPRCWYFRHEHFHQAGGDAVERVREGQNQYHAIFDNQRTVMVHASTPATALVAYGASVELTGPGGKSRVVALSYHKQGERESYDWPLCDVAVVLRMEGRTIRQAAIAMGWVAPTPRRATEAERLLVGKTLDEGLARQAAQAAVRGATPLSKNAHKVPILEAVIRRTVLAAAAA